MDEQLSLEGGKLVLFKRNGLWQARIYLGERRYLYRSLKTSKKADAQRDALKLLHQTEFKLAEGLPVITRSFNSVIDEYVAYRQHDHKQGQLVGRPSTTQHTSTAMLRQIMRVSKFWREFAGSKAIDAVDDKLLRDYVPWRKSYYHRMATIPKNAKLNPTDKTLQWELMLGQAMIRFAHEQGYRGNKPLPVSNFVVKLKRVRPAFTLPEYVKLYRALRSWIYGTANDKWRYTRRLLRDYVLVLANSGIRVGEANNLRWRDVVAFKDDHGRSNVQLHVSGKTGARVVIPRVAVARYLDRMRQLRGSVTDDDWVFAMSDGSQIITLIDQFDKVLINAGLTVNSSGAKFSLYSHRHFYAVMAIQSDIDIYTIARNMGTSVAMIEQYYGRHATPATRAAKLGGKVHEAKAVPAVS